MGDIQPALPQVFVTFTFPVTGGAVNLHRLTGTIDHQGGILFLSLKTGKKIEVSHFTISLRRLMLTAIVNGNPKTRVPLLTLSLRHARITPYRHTVRISKITARLTSTAARALNAAFGTTLFKAGLELGTASTLIRFCGRFTPTVTLGIRIPSAAASWVSVVCQFSHLRQAPARTWLIFCSGRLVIALASRYPAAVYRGPPNGRQDASAAHAGG